MLKKFIILIDPGHGGQDPGAVNSLGLQEKKITLKIGIKLKNLLKNSNLFYPVLTRNDDSYVSLKKRRDFLKNNHVSFLISIHVDSSKKKYVSGASIWITTNERMHREINNFIKDTKEHIYFPKNIQNLIQNKKYDLFLKKTILDLQFNNFQKMEINLSNYVFQQFKKIIKLDKITPNYASLGILSSINTPSMLIETGFITNFSEEKKLRTDEYQNKIANAIYMGLKNYFQDTFLSNLRDT
ncbi:N-acetylmuramoyl-L-alanine amidase [Buchnera aphidicola]|uniref:N-acetylmuramoyl-L-alanine amidase n=1 Tax=Buchnera aphidicola TaxID=9 RepID=UPI00164B4E66|nr:N-acetylmuramoyl-L-alanine amidase [Buchnera aphidicola]